jgi:hypothetical protein
MAPATLSLPGVQASLPPSAPSAIWVANWRNAIGWAPRRRSVVSAKRVAHKPMKPLVSAMAAASSQQPAFSLVACGLLSG